MGETRALCWVSNNLILETGWGKSNLNIYFLAGRAYDCSQAGQFPSPYSCAEYYVCVYTNPRAYVFHCPADLLYDPILRVCNWPQAVNCDLNN